MQCWLIYITDILDKGSKVSLTVEGGVSLVGPHCSGTVRLFCEGVELTSFGWRRYNNNGFKDIINRVHPDDASITSPTYPTNPAFVSVSITKVYNNKTRANFSSVLTVDLLEINKQIVKNISCGDLSHTDTVIVGDYFCPSVITTYQLRLLKKIEVYWTNLVS